jgi:hypothetical protein
MKVEDHFKKALYEKGKVTLSLEIRYIGIYKVKALMYFIKLLNIIVIPKRMINKKTIVIDCNFEIK